MAWSDMMLRWTDKGAEVRGVTGFLFLLRHIQVRLPGEAWSFDARAAPVVVRYVRERFRPSDQVMKTSDHRVPWGLAGWVPWGTPLFLGATAAIVADLLGAKQSALQLGLAVTVAGFASLFWGRLRSRALVARFLRGLRDHGLRVDGPYLVEAGTMARYVVFTDRGPFTIQAIVIAPLPALELLSVQWAGAMARVRPRQVRRAAIEVAEASVWSRRV